MARKYNKKNAIFVDLHDRQNIEIIRDNNQYISDEYMKQFEEQLESRSKLIDEFNSRYIQENIERKYDISEEEFEKLMREILKKNKLIKNLLSEQQED